MKNLKEYLENHENEEYRNIVIKPVKEIIGIEDYSSISELIEDYDIWISNSYYNQYNKKILKIVGYKNEIIVFNLFFYYPLVISIIFNLIYPILVSNYWLYFGMILIPIGLLSSSLIKTPLYNFSWLISIVILFVSIIIGAYDILGIVFPFIILFVLPRKAKILYRNLLIEAALKNELNLKFLFHFGVISLHNKTNDELIENR